MYRQYVQSGIAPGANTVTTSAIAANTIQPWQLSSSLLNPTVNSFTGDGTTTSFTLSLPPASANTVVVTVNGITQSPVTNYSTNNTSLVFTSAPSNASVIRAVQQAMIGTSIVPIDGSVTTSKLGSNLTLSGNTSFSGAISGTSVTLSSLTSGRITYASTGGLLVDSANLVFTGTNVGIGTTSPLNKLDVAGSVSLSSGGSNVFRILQSVGAGGYTGPGFYSDTSMGLAVASGQTIRFIGIDGNTEMARFDTSGNVAIGTTTAGTRLVLATPDTATTGQLRYARSADNTYYWETGRDNQLTGDFLFSNANGGAKTERMRIDASGNLLVGTITALSRLTTSRSAGAAGAVNGQIAMTHDTATTAYYISTIRADATNEPAGLTFKENATERMRIDASGNVGIGTSSPVAPLAVMGLTSSTSTPILYLQQGGGFPGYGYAFKIDNVTTGNLYLNRYGNNTSTDLGTLLTITTTGNVGIGTISPNAKLQVTTSSFPVLKVADELGGGAIALGDAAISSNYVGIWRGAANSISGGGFLNIQGNNIAFMSTDNVFGSATRTMTLDNSGNLLVGTTGFTSAPSPNAGLSAGNFRSLYGSIAVAGGATSTILTLSSSVNGTYIIQANFGAQGNAIYGGMLIVIANAGSFRIVTNGSGSSCALTLSGANVQITNPIGSALDATGSAILISN